MQLLVPLSSGGLSLCWMHLSSHRTLYPDRSRNVQRRRGVEVLASASLEGLFNRSGLMGKRRWSEIAGSLNSRLYVISSPILVRLRKPWKGHSWYSATGVDLVSVAGLREVREVRCCSSSTKVERKLRSVWDCVSSKAIRQLVDRGGDMRYKIRMVGRLFIWEHNQARPKPFESSRERKGRGSQWILSRRVDMYVKLFVALGGDVGLRLAHSTEWISLYITASA